MIFAGVMGVGQAVTASEKGFVTGVKFYIQFKIIFNITCTKPGNVKTYFEKWLGIATLF